MEPNHCKGSNFILEMCPQAKVTVLLSDFLTELID